MSTRYIQLTKIDSNQEHPNQKFSLMSAEQRFSKKNYSAEMHNSPLELPFSTSREERSSDHRVQKSRNATPVSRMTRATTKNSTDLRMTPMHHNDAINQYDFQEEAGTDPVSFKVMNAKILHVIKEWASKCLARTHTFHKIFQEKWKNKIRVTSTFKAVQRNLDIQSNDYIIHVKKCPAIPVHFDIYYNSVKKKINYQSKKSPDPKTQEETSSLPEIDINNTSESIDSPPSDESIDKN
jgi:hypothetical protein